MKKKKTKWLAVKGCPGIELKHEWDEKKKKWIPVKDNVKKYKATKSIKRKRYICCFERLKEAVCWKNTYLPGVSVSDITPSKEIRFNIPSDWYD